MRLPILLLCFCGFLPASDELTVYELLAPGSHKFAIVYDMATAVEASPYLFNPIRRGSVASDERVIDAATGKPLRFETVTYDAAKQHGFKAKQSADEYLQVILAHPVPKGGETRVRIFKTYMDAASYSADGKELVFERSFGIKRNVIVLPAGFELVACSAPGIVSTQSDGRIRLSFVNDRDDQLLVKLRGRQVK
ncbi:MAG: hypothetical protein JWO80_1820 [Bryobacterales bacterium]|nr:hypothetical protein [Bryobacterales bacterium]